jgi:NTE family protein
LNINPLHDHLEKTVDFAKVRALSELKLFVATTNVLTGRIKVFEGPELTADHVMASACLPYLFQAVEIDGVP